MKKSKVDEKGKIYIKGERRYKSIITYNLNDDEKIFCLSI